MGRILVTKEWYMSECSYFLQSEKVQLLLEFTLSDLGFRQKHQSGPGSGIWAGAVGRY